MSTQPTTSLQSRLETVIALARLFERIDASGTAPVAEQYQALVAQLKSALGAGLPAAAYPATAELYENLHYSESGLSQQPLERSVATEMMAAAAIHRAARR